MQNTIKKCLSVLLACLMIMSIATVAFADGGTLTVGTATGKAGEDVVIPVTLNADGVTSGVFKISYDKDVLTYKSATTATFGAYTIDAETAGTIKFAFANNGTAVAADKALITVKFTVNDGAAVGASTVSAVLEEADAGHHLKADGFFTANGNEVAVSTTAGSVTVEADAVEIIYGDFNDDGEIDGLDALYLKRYLNEWDGYSYEDCISAGYNFDAADVNCDGEIDGIDALYLKRYLNEWEGYEELPIIND